MAGSLTAFERLLNRFVPDRPAGKVHGESDCRTTHDEAWSNLRKDVDGPGS